MLAIAFLHMKIYKKRRQQLKGNTSNEQDYEAHARDRRRYEEESIAMKAPTVEFADDEDIDSPTFKLVQPKAAQESEHYPGASTDV